MIFKRLHNEDKAGLYLTLILHLALVIVLLLLQITRELTAENSFVMDFTREEELERQEAERAFKEDISERLDELIRSRCQEIRNVAIDASAPLKDDRNTPAEDLYKEAERLQQELREGQQQSYDELAVETQKPVRKEEKKEESRYSGPTVLSYNLEGRKATYLPIPAYKCYGGGLVTVIIYVDTQGKVIDAKVQNDSSSSDNCLREFAVKAAKRSRFNVQTTAPARQIGEICYSFIAQ